MKGRDMAVHSRIVILAAALCLCAASAAPERISYGPDSVVDSQPAASYVEPAMAVSPLDSHKLIAGSMVFGASGITIETFRSDDGGYSWSNTLLPLPPGGSLLGDVQAAFDGNGRAYMTGLGSETGAAGTSRNGLYVFGSANAGQTFNRLSFIQTPDHHSYDHEQLNIDRSRSRYRGRMYMSVLYLISLKPEQLNGLGILWSADGGRTFHGPVEVSRGWSFNSRPQVLPDGTVLFLFFHSNHLNDTTEYVQVSRSRDGGQTFSKPIAIGTREVFSEKAIMQKLRDADRDYDGDSVPQFAVSGFNVYGIWSDMRTGTSRLLFTHSTDGGKQWSTPREIFTSSDPTDAQYQPSIAVNKDGVLGVSWYNGSISRNEVSEMFAVSKDGAASFSQPAAISSTSAPLRTASGGVYSANAFPDPHGIFIGFVDPGSRYPSGGDYMDLDVDRDGAFHPIWIDARNGVYQVWTATVFPQALATDPARASQATVTRQTALEFGVGTWDATSHTLSVPVRLHNESNAVLYPPFTVVVTSTTNPYDKRWPPEVTVLNADNGQTGVGASFMYSAQSLGNLGRLMPGADTASRIWKLRIASPAINPMLLTDIRAYTATK